MKESTKKFLKEVYELFLLINLTVIGLLFMGILNLGLSFFLILSAKQNITNAILLSGGIIAGLSFLIGNYVGKSNNNETRS